MWWHRRPNYALPTQQEFENGALFLRLGSRVLTLICHESEAYRKRSLNRRNWKTTALWKLFENDDIMTIAKWPVIVAFSNFSGAAWTENSWCVAECNLRFQIPQTGTGPKNLALNSMFERFHGSIPVMQHKIIYTVKIVFFRTPILFS